MKKVEKSIFVENLSEELKSASGVIFVDFAGLGVKAQQDLKKKLKEADSKLVVVKNSLLKRAGIVAKSPNEVLSDTVLKGQTALVITGPDPISPLQIIEKFSAEFEVPKFKVGIIDGEYQEKEMLIKLARLPSKDILFGQVVSQISSPIYGLVGTLQGNLQKLIWILNEKLITVS